MIHDPRERGEALAEFFLEIEPRLFADLEESVTLARGSDRADSIASSGRASRSTRACAA